ncbi:MAG: type II secretion system F family protein, partial [Gammaproteobacteria bacterium]
MDLFHYKAIDTGGRIIKGQLDALNPVDLEVRLGRLGLELVHCKEVQATRLSARAGIKRKDLITFCIHLEQLLEAGVPMLDALTDLRDTLDHRRFQEITSAIIESIQGGKNLSEAMRDFPYVFSAVFVNLIKAGETTGQITRVLRNVIENLKWEDEQAAYTKRLFMYPAFVAVITLGALV